MRAVLPWLLVCSAAVACATPARLATSPARSATPVASSEPKPRLRLLEPWTGPYGGVPDFEAMVLAELEPAFEAAIAAHLAELDAIANDPDPPTFENTIVQMERSGGMIRRLETLHGVWRGNVSTPEFREIDAVLAPMLSEYESAITHNPGLFHRISAVREDPDLARRSPADRRLVDLIYDLFAMRGATLQGAAAKHHEAIERRLAQLHNRFADNVLADEERYVVWLDRDELGGLPSSVIAAAAAAAAERGQPHRFAITNTRSSVEPFLTYATDRALRERVWRNYSGRGDNADEHDNNAIIVEILRLRDERVGLLGFDNYAQWRLQDRMAKTPERAMALMKEVWPAAVRRAREEIADMQKLARSEGATFVLEPWDHRFYAEKVRRLRFELDSNEVEQYLQLDRLREAMFMVADRLFGFRFTELPPGAVSVFHEDVRVFEVTDSGDGRPIGLWYLDPFARPGKRSGAWASTFRGHTTLDGGTTVLCSNNSNFAKAPSGQPVLMSWDDARTFFHEFGHALHALSSNVDYRSLNSGVRDYTEFQSQLLERWLLTDEVVGTYLTHARTGAPMPADLVAKLRESATFNEGFATTEYLASAIMDLKFHTVDPTNLDPRTFERESLERLGLPPQIVMRHRPPHFGHIFSSEGYAAGYYGYLWADVLTADAAEAFAEAPGGFYDPAMARKLVDELFAPRNAVDPDEAYRRFRGRDAQTAALMRDRGLTSPGAKGR